jgi:uncharacterized protein (DUF1501 family)
MPNETQSPAQLNAVLDAVEQLILTSPTELDVDDAEAALLTKSMKTIFIASVARARVHAASEFTTKRHEGSANKRAGMYSTRFRELAALLLAAPDFEPRLRAVFDGSEAAEEDEFDKILTEIGKLIDPSKTR